MEKLFNEIILEELSKILLTDSIWFLFITKIKVSKSKSDKAVWGLITSTPESSKYFPCLPESESMQKSSLPPLDLKAWQNIVPFAAPP